MSATDFAKTYGSKLTAHINREKGERYPGIPPALEIRRVYGIGLNWIYAGDEKDLPDLLRRGIVMQYVRILADEFDVHEEVAKRIVSRRKS